MSQYLQLFWQLVKFGMVGVGAAMVHFIVALAVIHYCQLSLPVANIIGFVSAFWVSLFGHQFFSFNATTLPLRQTFWRFFLVAIIGFIVNESCVIALRQITTWSNQWTLATAILLSAAVTFVLSRVFAFKTS